MTIKFLTKYEGELNKPGFKEKFGSLYETYKTESIMHKLTSVIFFLRRLFLAIIFVMIIESAVIQIYFLIQSSFFMLIYQIAFMPHTQKSPQKIEIFNEATLLIVGYCLIPVAIDTFNEDSIVRRQREECELRNQAHLKTTNKKYLKILQSQLIKIHFHQPIKQMFFKKSTNQRKNQKKRAIKQQLLL
ncbi:UNKNOWN [Stylonychia lemnae]|uniref:Uncharacterized protein n=1 Tax=Stylonychia lemnae TaxID=5949 RepID=A0A078AWK4_STYLE|nr:UNKNOWN [Stylonychia lemnae]|eukprot:CDW85632.1 UNKNOWN [Stylonychia lemnae]